MKNRYVRKTIELLLDRADSEWDFKVAKYAIDDYISEGYKIGDMYDLFHKKYKRWLEKRYI
jgi:hypothetical protein